MGRTPPYDAIGRVIWAHLRHRALTAVQRAQRAGTLPSPVGLPCADCGRPATRYEHRDYLQRLAVEPICASCNHRRGPAAFNVRGWLYTLDLRELQIAAALARLEEAVRAEIPMPTTFKDYP